MGIVILITTLYPILHLQISGRIDFLGNFYRGYHKNPFSANFVLNLLQNFKDNAPVTFKSLFLSSDGRILYGAALHYPLLISQITLLIILFSLFIALRKRETADKIIFIWLGLGFLGGISFVSGFQPRYIIIAVIPLLILTARFISRIFNFATRANFIKQRLIFWLGTLILAWLVLAEITQLVNYYIAAPVDLEECRRNSYGCQEAALFLSKMPDIKNCSINSDARMTVDAYLKYYRGKNKESSSGRCTYYIFWAPQSHPKEYWDGLFWYGYQSFKQAYPKQMPIKTIYYPDGLAAINIFKIEEN